MTSKVAEAISALREALLHLRLIMPEATEEYQALNNSYLSGFESDLCPACIFLPKSKEGVAAFVRSIRPFVSKVKFAIRAAGQQPLPGCANVQDGTTADPRSLRGLHIEDKVVQIAAGER
ncbi:hypothetical protein RRF57_008802 [Xylaria bambusicola]|uniref:Uncharacterized protein n=1 Tax=Xylaria bambusicola TaxID=326684 RepID=A0AAN7UNN1_9PEZI